MLPGFGGFGDGHQLSGLGDAAADAARLRQVLDNLESNIDMVQTSYGPAIAAFANVASAVNTGNYAAIESATIQAMNTISSIASTIGPVGAIVGAVLQVLTRVVEWLVRTYPAAAVDCFWTGQHLRHACRLYKGDDNEATAAVVYRDEGRFWLGTTLTRSSSLRSWSLARNSENRPKWSDQPMVPIAGHTEGDVFYEDLINFDGISNAAQRTLLKEFCYPRRMFTASRPSGALGAKSWPQFLREHPDPEGSSAARIVGDEVHRGLLANGDPLVMSGPWGDLCWHVGFLVKCTGFPDSTIVQLLRKMCDSQGPAADVAAAAGIVACEPGRAGGMMYWSDGLADSVWHFIKMSRYQEYHFNALLNEYNRRGLGVAAMRLAPMARDLKPLIGSKTETKTGMSTGAKVAVGVGVTGVVAGVLKLLKVW